jgi:hypothetical protein
MKYEQMVVLQGCKYNNDADKQYFLDIFKKHNFRKPKIVGVVTTLPSKDEHGNIIPNTGGRQDLFFFINNKDINKFAIWRLIYDMKWLEDIYHKNEEHIYPKKFLQKYPPRW